MVLKYILCCFIVKDCFFVAAFIHGNVHAPEQMSSALLSIYYESNSTESTRFIVNQLEPVMELLHKHITLRLIPFGRAKSINYGLKGFTCHNGQSECLGNMVQDCTLNLMYRQTDLDRLKYVVCEMKTQAGLKGNPRCILKTKVPREDVVRCITSSHGTQLQLSSEYLTKLIQPTHIPTITINGIYNPDVDKHAQVDLMGTLCSLMKNIFPCATYYNQIALDQIFHKYYMRS